MSQKTGLIVSLCVAMGPVTIMFLLSAFNITPMPGGMIAGMVVLGSFIGALITAKSSGNL